MRAIAQAKVKAIAITMSRNKWAISETVGSVAGLWRYPVKSMRGERVEQADLTVRGLMDDRAYALIEADTGKVA